MKDVWNSFVIYTTETGGRYSIMRATREEFDEIVATRRIERVIGHPSNEGEYATPSYVAFVQTLDDFDFVLGRQREVARIAELERT